MPAETCQIWIGGEQYVLHDEEIDEMLKIGREAETIPAAWEDLEAWLESRESEGHVK